MKTIPALRRPRRLPGEIAFDRCFLPLVAVIVLQIIYRNASSEFFVASEALNTEEFTATISPPLWHAWLWFTFGLLLAVLWVRAVLTLARAWRDPSSRVVRFSSCVVLIPFAIITFGLLLHPFR